MAATTHGFYGLGSSKTADFGLAASMTLPIVKKSDKEGDSRVNSATMPHEKKKVNKKARFELDQLDEEDEQPQDTVVLRDTSKKPSWRSRMSNLFKRNSKIDKEASTAAVADPENDPIKRTVDDMEVIVRKAAKKKRRKKRDAKSRSTAFETNMPYLLSDEMHGSSSDFLRLSLRPMSANDFKDIWVTLKRQSDGFGVHLSGGLPPISVTYVQPGSEAESARIMVGDIVTEVNGHDCRKGVGISRIMELKSLIQQTPSEHEEAAMDDGVWEKIKEKQEELDSDSLDDNEITRIDDSSESEVEPPAPEVETPPKKKKAKSPSKPKAEQSPKAVRSSPKMSSKVKSPHKGSKKEELSSLVTAQQKAKAPIKIEQPPEVETSELGPESSTPKKKTKKKKRQSGIDSEPNVALSPIKPSSNETPPATRTEASLTSPAVRDLSPSPSASPKLVTIGIIKKPKRSTKKTGSLHEAKKMGTSVSETEGSHVETSANASSILEEQPPDSREPEKKVKKKKKRPKERPLAESAVDDSTIVSAEESMDKILQELDEMTREDTPKKPEKDSDVHRKKKKKRPKEQSPTHSAVNDTSVAMATEDSLDKPMDERNEMTVEDAPHKSAGGDPQDAQRRKSSKGKAKQKKKKMKTAETSLEGGDRKKRSTTPSSHSKLKTTEESALELVDYEQEPTRDSVHKMRRKSVDVSNSDAFLVPISSEKRSTSYHDLDKEDRKMFREELREASKSEYDIQERAAGGPKVEIDPNVRVKKSGVVIGKRKTNERPSIFEDEGTEEGVENTSPEGKKSHRKLVMDISVVPKTSPSLGLKHGRDKKDVINRSLSKRRPASFRKTLLLDTKKEVLMGKERVDLSEPGDGKLIRSSSIEQSKATTDTTAGFGGAHAVNVIRPKSRPRKQSIIEYMESLQKAKYSSSSASTQNGPSQPGVDLPATIDESSNVSPSVAKRIFENPGASKPLPSPSKIATERQITKLPQRAEVVTQERLRGGGRKEKTVEQPVKRLEIASDPQTKTSTSNASNGTPEWVTLAQSKRNRNNSLLSESKPAGQGQPAKTTPPKPQPVSQQPALTQKRGSEDDSIPKMGTVLDTLAKFQKFK